ncbi:hypothetical protein GOP47_0030240 [Adiantum capillus-veneris]|nr:hypothetical protein GOP47_0030240 [Adiantum capillus-veneris]
MIPNFKFCLLKVLKAGLDSLNTLRTKKLAGVMEQRSGCSKHAYGERSKLIPIFSAKISSIDKVSASGISLWINIPTKLLSQGIFFFGKITYFTSAFM